MKSDLEKSKQKLPGTCNIPDSESCPQETKHNHYSPKNLTEFLKGSVS